MMHQLQSTRPLMNEMLMRRKTILKHADLNQNENKVETSSGQTHLISNMTLAKGGNQYAREFIKEDGSCTNPNIKLDRNTLFSLRKTIRGNRKQELSFDETFYLYLLTSKDPSAITVRIKAYMAQKYKLGNCGELSYLSMKYLRRYNRNIYMLEIVDSDHVIVMIDNPDSGSCVVLDTLNQKFYSLSEIYKGLQCYAFEKHKDDPHVLAPFTRENKLRVKIAILCFKNLSHNKDLVEKFYEKLDVITKSFEKFSNDEDAKKVFSENIKNFKSEVKARDDDLNDLTNLEVERLLDEKIKNVIALFKEYIEKKNIIQKEDFFIDIIINMRSLSANDSSINYFKHLIYFEPLFSKVLEHIKVENDPLNSSSFLKSELNNKPLLNLLLQKMIKISNNGMPHISRGKAINLLLEAGADPEVNCDGNNVLTWSIKQNLKMTFQYLINHYPIQLFEKCDMKGYLPLHLAVRLSRTEMVKNMIEMMPNKVNMMSKLIDLQDEDGFTAIHYACEIGHIGLCEILLSKNPKVSLRTKYEGFLPIHLAAKNGHLDVIKLVLNYNWNVINLVDCDGLTALHFAADYGHLDVAQELVKQGASLDHLSKDKSPAIRFAARSGKHEIVRWMLNVSPKLIDYVDADNWNLLHFACNSGNNIMVQELLEQCPHLLKPTKEDGFPIHIAAKKGHINMVELILKKVPTLIDRVDKEGFTPLHIAVYYGHLDLIEALLNQGANSTIRNHKGHTPLDMTKQSKGETKIVEQIVSLLNKYNPINQVPLSLDNRPKF